MSEYVDFEYEVTLRVVHRELSNPDMPSLNRNTLAEGIALKASQLMDGITVTVKSANLFGRVAPEDAQPLHIDPPDDVEDRWMVVGDLREAIDLDEGNTTYDESTNYAVRDMLVAQGWSKQNLDPEYSCFYGYAPTQEAAIRLQTDAMTMVQRLKDVAR